MELLRLKYFILLVLAQAESSRDKNWHKHWDFFDSNDFDGELYASHGLKNEDLQTEMLIDRFFEAAWEADDLLDYIGGNPFDIAKQTKNKQNGNKQQSKPKEPVQSVTDDETKALIEQYADELYSDEMNFDPKDFSDNFISADTLNFAPPFSQASFLDDKLKPTEKPKEESKEEKNKKYKSFWESMWKVPLGWILGKRIN